MKKSAVLGVFALTLMSGCLKTREQLRGEADDTAALQRQTAQQQRDQAREQREKAQPGGFRFEEIDEQIRQFNGRLDTLETRIAQIGPERNLEREVDLKARQAQDQKLQLFEDALKKLEAQVATLSQDLERLKAPPAATPKSNAGGAAAKTSYDEGEELFNGKKWREAIVAYQKYRDGNPKGKQYADATYKMGVAFQELGMKDEARAFFEEVREKFPASKEAKKAAIRMKNIK